MIAKKLRTGNVQLEMSQKEALALVEVGFYVQSFEEVWYEDETKAFGKFMANTLRRVHKALVPIVVHMRGGQE